MDFILLFDQYLLVNQQTHYIITILNTRQNENTLPIGMMELELAHVNEINHDINLANTLF